MTVRTTRGAVAFLAAILAVAGAGCLAAPDDGDLFGDVTKTAPASSAVPRSGVAGSTTSTSGGNSSASSSIGTGGAPADPQPCSPDLAIDPNNCGACGNVCATVHLGSWTTDLVCVAGECKLDCAAHDGVAPYFRDCDGVVENGCEADLTQDPTNCGGCGIVCNGGWKCQVTSSGSKCSP